MDAQIGDVVIVYGMGQDVYTVTGLWPDDKVVACIDDAGKEHNFVASDLRVVRCKDQTAFDAIVSHVHDFYDSLHSVQAAEEAAKQKFDEYQEFVHSEIRRIGPLLNDASVTLLLAELVLESAKAASATSNSKLISGYAREQRAFTAIQRDYELLSDILASLYKRVGR